jgi:hypothetical protein
MTNTTPQIIDSVGAQQLAAAVIAQGVAAALGGEPEAIYWLYSDSAAYFASLAGYDESGHLVKVARKCRPGRHARIGRINPANLAKALRL